ncbi:MAG TPA: transporter, partial [Gammaproteobacteria bacterium]|nr:transporter [Gammaproteobacteria bacterium]
VVSLYGYVRTEIEKDAVLQLAASVRGVTSVEDRLVVVE